MMVIPALLPITHRLLVLLDLSLFLSPPFFPCRRAIPVTCTPTTDAVRIARPLWVDTSV